MNVEVQKPSDLSTTAVGLRVFIPGEADKSALDKLQGKVTTVDRLAQQFKKIEKRPTIVIITTDDLSASGIDVLGSTGLMVVKTDTAKSKRRAILGRKLIGDNSAAKGKISYADMLNSLGENLRTHPEISNYVFVSPSLVSNPEVMARQIICLKSIYDLWQKERPGKLAIAGSLIENEHDRNFVYDITIGKKSLDIENLGKVFPNNALSLVPADAKFSGVTDNALIGTIEIDGRPEPIGGNEDFFYGLMQMVFYGKDCILLIDPSMPGERLDKTSTVEAKYSRRLLVQHIYATRLVEKAIKREVIKPEEVEDIIDQHLFFAKIDFDGQPEVVLTARQKLKGVCLNINS